MARSTARRERARARELLQRLEQDIDPDETVSNLRIGEQQIVEIAKALTQDVRVLIMDEPTSALSQAEVEVLFRVIDELKARGVAIVYISHKLDELLRIGDQVTVLRDGRIVADARTPRPSMSTGSSSRWWAAPRPRCSRAPSIRWGTCC